MPWLKKIHTRNLITKKKIPAARKFPFPPPPPNNFSNGQSLQCKGNKINQELINEMLLIPEGTDKSRPLD